MKKAFKFEKRNDGIGLLYFDVKGSKVNKFSTTVMEELEQITQQLKQETLSCLLLLSGKKSNIFIAGADINEIKDLTDPQLGYNAGRRGQDIFDSFANFSYPTIAVIDGQCLGGGTELSLACTYRLASDSPDTKISLPEVQLGILPGWGGTQRLPKLIGIQRALDIILSGKRLNAKRALRAGLVDKIIAKEWLLEGAIKFAEEIITGKTAQIIERRKPKGAANLLLEKTAVGRKVIFSQARKMVLSKTGGHYPAPLKAIDVIQKTYGMSLKKGLQVEAKALGELIVTPICKSLVQIFFWTEEIKNENGTDKKTVKTKQVDQAAILGAGVMGGGIAQLFASRSIDVRVKDITHNALTKAYQQAAEILKKKLKRRRLTKEQYRETMHRITGTTDYSGFKKCDLVVEAIVEDLNIKRTVLAEVEAEVEKETVIASNTSSLLIDDMAEALKIKKRFVGMHFFNPVHKMPLVEIVRGAKTSDQAVATLFELCKRTGKTPIVVNDGPGFLVNRLLVPYMVEAISLLEEGHSIKKIDGVMKKFGMPMGPIELFDEVGLDVAHKVSKILMETMADRMADSDLIERLTKAERLGKKNGLGFYKYEGRKKIYDDSIEHFITVKEKTEISDENLTKRMVYPMINEAARCLDEKIITKSRDVDVGMIFGTGFAPFRGGLLKYADSQGIDEVIEHLNDFKRQFGDRFEPCSYLISLHANNSCFYPVQKEQE